MTDYNYNTEHICRYNGDDLLNDFKNLNINEENEARDLLYKVDLVYIFNLKDDDEFDCLSDILSNIYEKVKEHLELKQCMKLAASKILSEDEVMGLCILYSYDFMYLTHECVSEYLKYNNISLEKIDKLKKLIKEF